MPFRVLALVVVAALVAFPGPTHGQAEPTANDGAGLSGESPATQGMFEAVWGKQAAEEWVAQHNAALTSQTGTAASSGEGGGTASQAATPASGAHLRPGSAPPGRPDAPPIAADTTVVPITKIADSASPDMPIGADLMDIDQIHHRLYVSNHNADGVDVFDVSGPMQTYLTTVRCFGGAEGIAAAPDINKGFAATPSGALVAIGASPDSPADNCHRSRSQNTVRLFVAPE